MFPSTHLSVIERVRSGDADVRRLAFGDLAGGYWKAAYRYLRLRWRLPPETAEDIVQSFFTTAFEKHYLEQFDPEKARFRTFLRTCLDRFVQNTLKAEGAAKRGGRITVLSLDFAGAERELPPRPEAVGDAERFFHDETIRCLFARALDRMRRDLAADGQSAVMAVFERHDLAPSPHTTYASVAAELSIPVTQVTNHLHKARLVFREAALAELRAISATDAEYRDEARALFGAQLAP